MYLCVYLFTVGTHVLRAGVLKLFSTKVCNALLKRIHAGEEELEGTYAICFIGEKFLSCWLRDRELGRKPSALKQKPSPQSYQRKQKTQIVSVLSVTRVSEANGW